MHRRPLDLTLYLVTDTRMCGGPAEVAATAVAAVEGGVTLVQVRDPHADDREFTSLARGVTTALAGSGVPVLLNDRVHLVAETGAHGAHVGQHDLDVRAARELLGPDLLLGLSCQSVAHVDAVDELLEEDPQMLDYLGIGPVWEQATKPDAAQPGGIERLVDLGARTPLPCVAIGGIDVHRIGLVARSGVAGAAVVSAICASPHPTLSAHRLRQAWEENR